MGSLQTVMDQSPPPPAAAGQLAELERLFQAHHGAVMRAAYRITGNRTDAEDVLQTVFMRLLSRRVDSAAMENVQADLQRAALEAAAHLVRGRRHSKQSPHDCHAPP